ncbi:hypothetical protein OH720_14130 [Pseudomonas sp. WJP1]|uniref:hypothetical protein n=1 Tax=Pseudomonas sp. WJP1 TaxID=2986947 RepID=UPI00234B04D8|nr:hypothetical protein [Pseudomonas sp. WJP1]WCM54089.1 hypothetical protein OH720_14130 [Pseudomonas sp. WJP1]
MGHSTDIKAIGQENTAFQKYIDERNTELDKTAAEAQKVLDAQIKKFYADGKWDDAQPLASGSYQHLATASTWSLSNVVDMIENVRTAVFGGKAIDMPPTKGEKDDKVPTAPAAKGSTISPTTQNLLTMMAGTEAIIANAAFQAITGILSAIKTGTETDLSKQIVQKDIIPGMSMFVCVMENKFSSKDFFNSEIIVQNFYIYDVRMSADRARALANFDRINGLISQQNDLEGAVGDLSQQVHGMAIADYKTKNKGDLKAAIADYKSDFIALEDMIKEINTKISETAELINQKKLLKAENNAALVLAKRKELVML